MRLLIAMAVIVGCYACSDTHLLRQGDITTSEAGDTTVDDPNEADAKVDPTGTISEALGGAPSGIFKSFIDAGRGKGDEVKVTKIFSFIANENTDNEQITYGSTSANKYITMQSSRGDRTYNQTTEALSRLTDSFTQNGRDATTSTPGDTVLTGREYKGLLDLLIVVDNSDSMKNKNKIVKENLGNLIPNIQNTDWKILMMNSESRGGEGRRECRRIITTQRDFKIQLGIILGENKAWRENITWQMRKGLAECRGFYNNNGRVGYRKNERSDHWMRKGSVLAALIITDEDFQCSRCKDNNCNRKPLVCSDGASDALPRLKCNSFHCGFGGLEREFSAYRSTDKLAFYAIINDSNLTCQGHDKNCKIVGCQNSVVTNPCYQRPDDRLRYRHNIEKAIRLFSSVGVYTQKENITGNLQSILTKISQNIEGRLKNRFKIRDAEIESVTVKGMSRTDYRRDGNYLIFTGNPPDPSDRIVVRYREITNSNAREYDRIFRFRHTPDPNTVSVMVNRNPLSQSGNWQVSGNTIEFLGDIKSITPSGANIVVSYKRRPQDVGKQGSFNLQNWGGSYILPTSVSVSKGCSYYTSSGFSFNGTTVTFDRGNEPDHGQRVCFKYQTVANRYSGYSLNVVSGSTNFSCRRDGQPVTCSYANNYLRFTDPSQFPEDVNGIQVTVSYDKPRNGVYTTNLNKNYVKESVTLSSGGMTCNHQQLVFSGNKLDLMRANNRNCPFLSSPQIGQQMFLSYRTHNQTFIIYDDNDQELKDARSLYKTEIWEVTVDGQPTTEFTIDKDKYTLSFDGDLGDNKKVVVTVSFMNN